MRRSRIVQGLRCRPCRGSTSSSSVARSDLEIVLREESRMAATAAPPTSFPMRRAGSLGFDPLLYEEVEADRTATGQALVVVVLSSLGAGIGARGLGSGSLPSIVFISALSLLAWAAWALLTYEIGVRVMPEPQTRSDVG